MIILYSTHCPKCKVLEAKLNKSGLSYEVVDDTDKVVEKGREAHIMAAPLLEVDGEVMDFAKAVKYVNEASK